MDSNPLGDAVRERLANAGPQAALPVIGPSAGDLTVGADGPEPSRRRTKVLAVALVAAALVVAGVAVAARGSDDEARADGPAGRADPAPTSQPVVTTEATTTDPASTDPTTTDPTTTTAPTAAIPVDRLPRHEAVFRDGKLVLQGTLPDADVGERFRAKAAEVIGADNVIVRYQYDPRVPVPTDGRVRVDESFLFDVGSAAIDPAYTPVFDLGVAALTLNPGATMRIRGHTDATGDAEANRLLSLARAQAGADYLTAAGIDPARLTVEGVGPDEPVAGNDTPEGRAENRRIEVELLGLLAG